jgi:hypothetical protein
MSGAWTRIYAMYVCAGLCPKGCGDTLREEGSPDGLRTRCEDCDWLGPARVRSESILEGTA